MDRFAHAFRGSCLVALLLCAVMPRSAGASAEASDPPALQIVAPEAGCVATVGDRLQVLIVVQEQLDVATVVVMCDARGVGMIDEPPYAVDWDTSSFAVGEHAVRAFAYLSSGERIGAAPVVVTLHEPEISPFVAAASGVAAPDIDPVLLREGTPVLLQTVERMVSGRVAEGSLVRFRVVRDVIGPHGEVLIAYGDFGQGTVTRSRRRGMFGKAGQLEFTVEAGEAVDGTVVPLRAEQALGGQSNKNLVIASTLVLSILSIFIQGTDVDVPAGTEIATYVDHDTVIHSPQSALGEDVIRGEPLESVSIVEPSDGAVLRHGEDVTIVVQVTPEQKFASLRMFCNGQQMDEQGGQLAPITWPTRMGRPGEYVLEAEVRFTNRRVIRSAPVTVTLSPGP